MTKFTKITAAVVAAAAVLSFAGCSNNTSSASSDTSSTASTAEAAKTAEAASTAAATAEADTASTAEVAAPATAQAETPAFDVTAMYGDWLLAAVNDGTNTMNVADFAASLNADVESCMIYVTIDENTYTSTILDNSSSYPYTVNESGITVDMDGIELPIVYDVDGDFFAYGVAQDEVTYKYVFMRNTGDEAEAAPATAQAAAATAEAAE